MNDAALQSSGAPIGPILPGASDASRVTEPLAFIAPSPDAVAKAHNTIAGYTRAIFPGDVQITRESDPELPTEYFVVSAVASGEVEQIARRNHQWHAGLRSAIGDLAWHYRLSLDVQ